MSAIDQINQGGTTYEIVPEIAELFKTTKAYHTGDHVIYEAGWYTFKADKSAGAWDATKVDGPFKVTNELSSLKSDLPQTYVALKGENQLQPQNIAGVTFDKEEGTIVGENLFLESYLGETGYYAQVDTSTTPPTIAHGANTWFRWYAIPVDGNAHYTFTEARFAFLAIDNTIGAEAIGTTQQYVSQIDTTADARFLILSYGQSTTSIEVHKVTTGYIYSNFVMPEWMTGSRTEEKNKYAVATGNLASGGNLQLTSPRNNLRKGERIIFEGKITSFSALTIGLTYGTSLDATKLKNYFVIDGTNISYHATNKGTAITVAHGLTISDNIQIIWEMSAVATCKITLISDGNLFAHEFTNFVRQAVGNPFVLSDGTVLTDCKLTWACNDIDKSIWMFGDSYFAYSDARWTYYLHQYGYDQNCLLDGFPGEGGVNGRVAFNNLLQFGTPKYAVWCLGMNDGSDSDSAPATDWVTNRDYFLQYCQDNNVTPIFGTIPTVPTINHEQKNAWIRSSGYRYIDFAKAVGANANGVWHSGMLSSDGVHPTAQGARALFARVLLDLPEIMIGGYGTPTAINS